MIGPEASLEGQQIAVMPPDLPTAHLEILNKAGRHTASTSSKA